MTVLLALFGGMALLLYGIRLSGEALQRALGARLRGLLTGLSRNRILAVLSGAAITAIIQSSAATTLMLIGFVAAGLMTFRATLGVILGADIGTTFTVQLIAFRVTDYAPLLIGLGFTTTFVARRRVLKDVGQALLGLGLLFLGLKLILDNAGMLKASPLAVDLLAAIANTPMVGVLVGAVFSALVTSSTATLGLALAFKTYDMTLAAALALTAALFHVFNHSVFKSLLFCGAGSVVNATGERDMEHLGGLIARMPQTAFAFLIGCAAISALPPLNGFVSEWLIFQAILQSPQLPSWGLKFLVPAVGALLALSATLAAACFVKAFGVTFLGRPRSSAAGTAQETDRFSLAAMFAFAALCFIAGILPGLFIDALAPVVQALVGDRMPAQTGVEWLSIVPIAQSRSSYNGLLVFLFMLISGALAAGAIHRLASDRLRRAPAWDCGYPDPSPATQYTASSFAQPIRRVFGEVVFLAREKVEMPPPADPRPARLTVVLHDPVWETLYLPLAAAVSFAAERLNLLQFLTIRQFLSLVFAALVILLLALALWP